MTVNQYWPYASKSEASDIIAGLIEDGYLVLKYASRAGKLVDDTLPHALREADTCLREGRDPDMAALSKALNAAVIRIEPLTLIDLRLGRSPFDHAQYPYIRRVQYCLCGLSVLVAASIAFYSHAVLRQEGALREYHETQAAKISDKFAVLRRLVTQEKVLRTKDPRAYEAYVRSVGELKDLSSRILSNRAALVELSQDSNWPFERELKAGLDLFGKKITPSPSPTTGDGGSSSDSRGADKVQDDVCEQVTPLRDKATDQELAQRENLDEYCFTRTLNLGPSSLSTYAPSSEVGEIQDRMVLYNVWILPFLSGLLGAAVFLLRDSLNPMTATFGASRAIVWLAIGAVSGIIIGWFWAPSSLVGTELGKASSIPLALAFVTGYSIDILFSALERMRRAL